MRRGGRESREGDLGEIELALEVVLEGVAPLQVGITELPRVAVSHFLTESRAAEIGTVGLVVELAVAGDGVLLLGLVKGQEEDPLVLPTNTLEVFADVDTIRLLLPLNELLDEASMKGDHIALLHGSEEEEGEG